MFVVQGVGSLDIAEPLESYFNGLPITEFR